MHVFRGKGKMPVEKKRLNVRECSIEQKGDLSIGNRGQGSAGEGVVRKEV